MDAIAIASEHLKAKFVPFGASLTDLRLTKLDRPLVLGFRDPNDFTRDKQFMGAVIGRYANRIARGHAVINGKTLSLKCNENGVAHLHGGETGFAHQNWSVDQQTDCLVSFTHFSPDGEGGFPGNLLATAEYEVEGSVLRLTLTAVTDQDTIVNLCHHPYFNLDGEQDISRHRLWIDAETYLPSDERLLPIGEEAPVARTPFDFRDETSLPDQQFNSTYCLHHEQSAPLRPAAGLQAGGVKMRLSTTQPGLHLYNGYKLKPSFEGYGGARYAPNAGLCLEAQAWPDSPNIASAPGVTLMAGERYQQVTEYKFSQT